MKRILLSLCLSFLATLSFSSFAENSPLDNCGQATATSDPGFCASFKSVSYCICHNQHLPDSLCNDMNGIYQHMLAIFQTVENACAWQNHTDKQTCIDDWTCYRTGGHDSHGNLCSSTGNVC